MYILQLKDSSRWYQAAETRMRQQRYPEALAAYRAAVEHDPAHAPAHAGVGVALFQLQRYEEALAALAHAFALQPDAPYAGRLQRLMGHAAQELGRPEAAAAHFERALQPRRRGAVSLHRRNDAAVRSLEHASQSPTSASTARSRLRYGYAVWAGVVIRRSGGRGRTGCRRGFR